MREGGVIADGYDSELDELRAIQNDCGAFLLDLETRERARTGIANLRVEYNRVHGFYIEVTHANAQKVPDDYRRRQTLKNAERYITPELKTFEDKALSAQERALAREKLLFDQLLEALAEHIPDLRALAAALAELDLLTTFAERSAALNLCRPSFTDEERIDIDGGPPSGGRAAGGHLRSQRPAPVAGAPPAADHRPEHGRQVHLHAPGRAHRAAGALRLLRAGEPRRASARWTPSSPASAPPTTWRAGARPSWWR